MTESMTTRYKALEDAITQLQDQLQQQDSVISKFDSLITTVHQHSESITQNFSLCENIQKTLSEMMLKLNRMEKQPLNPPLLPTPSFSPQTPPSSSSTLPHTPQILPTNTAITHHFPGQSSHHHPDTSHPRLPKLEIPLFSGDNPLGWLFQIERFFLYHNTPMDQRLSVASFYLTGLALQWFHWLHNTNQLSTWEIFARDLEIRFGPSSFQNHEAALYKLRQITSVSAYMVDFESISTRTTGLSHQNLLNCFLSGLKDDIQRELFLLKPQTLHEAMGMAKLVEDKLNSAKPSPARFPLPCFNPPPLPPPPPILPNPPTRPQNPPPPPLPLPIRRLTSTEMAARRARGLCFNCDEHFTPGHRCKTKQFLCLLASAPDDEADPAIEILPPATAADPDAIPPTGDVMADETPAISFHAFAGHSVPSTLRLEGRVNGHPVLILVDSGSTHNFIQTRMAKFLGLVVQPTAHLKVTIGNGDSLGCAGLCKGVDLDLGHYNCSLDLFLLPIFDADIVLGVQWLATLGPTIFYYKELYMQFSLQQTQIRLKGLQTPSYSQLSFTQCKRLDQTKAVATYFHLSITTVSDSPSPKIHPAPTSNLDTAFHSLLHQFTDIFASSMVFPPPRPTDHRIPLLPGSAPVNVRPYRYPHFQKTEIEKLVHDMLAEGIIQPSTSPFSSPVLLVKKKRWFLEILR